MTCVGELYHSATGSIGSSSGRLSSIASTANGVSTAAIKNPQAYMAPWSYLPETSDPAKAWQSLVSAVRNVDPNVVMVEIVVGTDTYYLHATVPSSFLMTTGLGRPMPGDGGGAALLDDLEFVLRPEDNLVLFRSASRTSIFIYPLTQPVSDGGSNRKRLDKIRLQLGWQELN